MFKSFISNFSHGYYFGIGGIGDLLLLLSSFYENYYFLHDSRENDIGIIFWANNPKATKQIFDNHFPGLKCLVTQNYLGYPQAKSYYDDIVNGKGFLGKAHIPDNFNYVNEWITVDNVFTNYGIRKNIFVTNMFKKCFNYNPYANENGFEWVDRVVVQPCSLSQESYKKKYITKHYIQELFLKYNNDYISFIGSESDREKVLHDYADIISEKPIKDIPFYTNLQSEFQLIVGASEVHSCDSWAKTLSRLCNIQTTYYVSEKIGDYKKIFGVDYDPGDNVFLKNWEMNIVNQFGYDLSYLGTNNNYLGV